MIYGFINIISSYWYNKEKTTAVWDKLKNINSLLNVEEFNKILTEQILKIKIHAIIDTANNNEDYHIIINLLQQ